MSNAPALAHVLLFYISSLKHITLECGGGFNADLNVVLFSIILFLYAKVVSLATLLFGESKHRV